jgi:hypothetical protein
VRPQRPAEIEVARQHPLFAQSEAPDPDVSLSTSIPSYLLCSVATDPHYIVEVEPQSTGRSSETDTFVTDVEYYSGVTESSTGNFQGEVVLWMPTQAEAPDEE